MTGSQIHRPMSVRRAILASLLAIPVHGMGQETLHLHIVRSDVETLVVEARWATLKLTPAASATLRRLTRDKVGHSLRLTIEGVQALEVRVQAEIDSGILQIPNPSAALRQRLLAYEAALLPPGR